MDEAARAYYERRAGEYDDWWHGTGRFAERDRPGWTEEVAALERCLAGLAPCRTLDAACGTGFLTRHLRGVVAGLDQSLSMVAIAQARLPGGVVVRGDAFAMPFAGGAFDRLVAAHFYGHLEGRDRVRFLREARRVAREVVVVDSALREGVAPEERQERILDDGSRHEIYKRFFTARELGDELGGGDVLLDGRWFVAVRA